MTYQGGRIMEGRLDSNQLTREYFDSLLLKTRYIDADLAETGFELFGEHFDTPIATAALSHQDNVHENGMYELALGAKLAGAINFMGMEAYEGELDKVMEAGAKTVRIVKPMADDADAFARIAHAKELGVFALGMDIDHAFDGKGGYDVVTGLPMKSKSFEQIRAFIEAAGDTPFIIKGVLSPEDACKAYSAGAAGIVVSHHHGIMDYSVPPLQILPEIVRAVGHKMKIFADCGIWSGYDAFKALALGADAVCVGRVLEDPLKEAGAQGVADKINELTGEMASVMARTGYRKLAEIDSTCIVRRQK